MEKTERDTTRKVIATILALLLGFMLYWGISKSVDDEWQPFYFNYDASKQPVIGEKGFSKKEISTSDYDTLADMASHDLTLRPAIKEAMEDGKVTNQEWNVIIELNEARWKKYETDQQNAAKQKLVGQL